MKCQKVYLYVFLIALLLAGCSGNEIPLVGGDEDKPNTDGDVDWNWNPDGDDVDKDTTDGDIEPEQDKEASETDINVTSAGGTFETDFGVILTIPEGAVEEDLVITISERPNKDTGDYIPVSMVYEFGPVGYVFKIPITVSIPYNQIAADGHDIVMPWTPIGDDNTFEELADPEFTGTNGIVQVSHFSFGFVGYLPVIDGDVIEKIPAIDVQPEFVFDPGTLNQMIAGSIIVKNIGHDTLTIKAIRLDASCSTEFGLNTVAGDGINISVGHGQNVIVTYRMSDPGQDSCNLFIECNDPANQTVQVVLKSTYQGTPNLLITPSRVDFGDHDISANLPASKTITLTHVAQPGSNALLVLHSFLIEDSSSPFNISPDFNAGATFTLSPGESINIELLFQPLTKESFQTNLVFETNDNAVGKGQASVVLTGKGVAAEVNTNPTSITFGNRIITTTSELTLAIVNFGGAKAIISSVVIENDSDGDFYLDTAALAGVEIDPQSTKLVTVQYTPSGEGVDNANIRIIGSNFYNPSPLLIPLSGTGVNPRWEVSKTTIDFGNTEVFQKVHRMLTVTNTTDHILNITGISVTGDSNFELSGDVNFPIEIQATQNVDLDFSFRPQANIPYSALATITTDDDLVPSIDVSLLGHGISASLLLSRVDGVALDGSIFFGLVPIGGQSAVELKLENTGTANLSVNLIAIAPEDHPDFEFSPSSLVVAPGSNKILTVTYTPHAPPVQDDADLSFITNDLAAQNVEIALTGVATDPQIEVAPITSEANPFDFGSLVINPSEPYGPRVFVISNSGVGPLTITSVSLPELKAGEFTINFPDGEPPFDIDNETEGSESFSFEIFFNPTAVTDYNTTVDIASNDLTDPLVQTYIKGAGNPCPEGTHDPNNSGSCWYDCDYTEGGVEVCDQVDNDCDNEIDEDFEIGSVCDGVGECGIGSIECHPTNNQFTICSTDISGSDYPDTAPIEICDNLDNDCDGTTDDGFNIGESCDASGACQAGVLECMTGDTSKNVCSTHPNGSLDQSSPESCDKVDNDCDGETDEDFAVNQACNGVGECGSGLTECSNAHEVICSTDIGGSEYPQTPPAELCNNLDDDCDSQTDETFSLGESCNPAGECRSGVLECNTANPTETRCSTGIDGTEYDGITELCDSLDNDCDGATDNGFELGQICPALGVCGAGVWECDTQHIQNRVCSTISGGSSSQAVQEICDNLDNDCDGETDDSLGLGETCTGQGECGTGVTECGATPSDPFICSTDIGGSAYPTEAPNELCNDLDDDCDGETDEGFSIDTICQGSESNCYDGTLECADTASTRCSTDPGGSNYPPGSEVCDGVDNDCDLLIDEDFALGDPCSSTGVCGDGTKECDPNNVNLTICSSGPLGSEDKSSPELCDSLDNDCDWLTDEDFNLDEDCEGVGECGAGKTECHPTDTSQAVCSTDIDGSESQAVTEICDNFDNDCDGETDEGFVIGIPCNGAGACGMGLTECDPNNTTQTICSTEPGGSDYPQTPPTELCNSIDDDCDGETDEGFAIGDSCQGVGACEDGTLECDGSSQTKCSTNPGGSEYPSPAPAESCNDVDDDCDGATDEDFQIGENCDGEGECGLGTFECLDTQTAICSTDIDGSEYPQEAPFELCDDRDNDCDGETDEDFSLGETCPAVGECAEGIWECGDNGDAICSTAANTSDELCNNLDDDCDGYTDEDFEIGGLCNGQGVCEDGTWECDLQNETARLCSTNYGGSQWQGSQEICDNIDNDCDGATDNGFAINTFCDGTGECGDGTIECDPGDTSKSMCSTNPGGSQHQDLPESCDDLDNDCDGKTDEDFSVGESCEGVGECGTGSFECEDENNTRCSTDPGGSEYVLVSEICDSLDNDCDSETDEDFVLDEICNGEGECGSGLTECNTLGEIICSTDPGGTQYPGDGLEELCDNLDNDCDGETDEGLGVGEICMGVGACSEAEGTTECGENFELICSTSWSGTEWAGSDEICDTHFETGEPIDNDCDGEANEDWEWGEECNGVGECQIWLGTWICNTATDRTCSVNSWLSEDYRGTSEVCDNLDNDCDGETDETFGLLGQSCQGVGECSDGQYLCDPNYEMGYICTTEIGGPDYNGTAEICDGLDNDCDGQTDEDWQIDQICNGSGACSVASGTWVCNGAADRTCSTDIVGHADYAGVAELCDNLDNDCDGETDEDWSTLGDQCEVAGGSCGTGYIECSTNADPSCTDTLYCSKNVTCGSQGGVQPFEVCNGIDDDCDGKTDEGFTISESTFEPIVCEGIGECGSGTLECLTLNSTVCSTDIPGSAYAGSVELCDSLDNDCDAQTDEDFSLQTSCDGVGECGAGLKECDPSDNTSTICSTDINGSADESLEVEACNGLDDTCDGQTDEGFEIGISCQGEGLCGSGTTECDEIGSTRCSTDNGGSEYSGSPETCNDLDDDCDGYIDEDFGIYDTQTGDAITCVGSGGCGVGVMECLNSTTAICCADAGGSCFDPSDEVCDGFDNDCNTIIDDPWIDQIGNSCTGVGACGIGSIECSKDMQGVSCSTDLGASNYQGSMEFCNDIDDDCDGLTDEDYNVGNDYPCDGQGECGLGYYECDPNDTGHTYTVCSTDIGSSQYNGSNEICDGLDNDCDGETDEGYHIGEICDGIGECNLGVFECYGSDDYICSTNPEGSDYIQVNEICDDRDNDCDGETDEDFTSLDQACTASGGCGTGVIECDSDFTLRCSTEFGGSDYTGSDELCNDIDDDCDGSTDEDFEIGDPCCTVAGECGECGGPGRAGTWECFGLNNRQCSVSNGGSLSQSETESCDGLDNDCDGETDENFSIGDTCCTNGECGSCGSGQWECDELGSRRCDTLPNGSNDNSRAELCDSLDNDCDGETDEDFSLGLECDGVGECGLGTFECDSPESGRCSTDIGGSAHAATQETCDNLDNDCDGLTDEDFFDASNPACDGTGECGVGTYVCIDDNNAVCSSSLPTHGDYQGTAELCDSLDNDCDGLTDEDLGIGESCAGTGECGTGQYECDQSGNVVCSTLPGGSEFTASQELCDNLDNDCDGLTDEDFEIGLACDGNGTCGQGIFECDCPLETPYCGSSSGRCSTDLGGSEYVGGSEICDYRDNDCDGLTDEDFPTLESQCDGVGQCGAGSIECKYGEADTQCSTDIGGSSYDGDPEICNDLDDDCDGATDEDFMVGIECDGVGECDIGHYECAGTSAFRCSTDRGGSQADDIPERCNDLDDDCDGATDEDFSSLDNICTAEGGCGFGVYECESDTTIRCSADSGGSDYGGSPELCNNVDDDCDGETDEDFILLATQCEGVGECGSGYYECEGLYDVVCDKDLGGTFYDGLAETCDNLDNDCDGETDETFPLGEGCNGVGQCGDGVFECDPNNAAQTICSTDIDGSNYPNFSELCDGLDNDCDGFVDEDWPELDDPCSGSGACAATVGHIECKSDKSGIICSLSPGGSEHESGTEICDGIDNNCDSQTDEGFGLGTSCSGIGECGTGIIECDNDGATRCSTHPGGSQSEATQEICDGLDNNCNDEVDEFWTNKGEACSGVGACSDGTWECKDNWSLKCSSRIGGSDYTGTESALPGSVDETICNGIDDDCDGQTDEGFNINQACEGVGKCGEGVFECATESTVRCSTDIGGTDYIERTEECDGIDNNCDGETDEGFAVGDECTALGTCGDGTLECNGAGDDTRCSAEPGGSTSIYTAELCDSLDNDCDGETDEDFGLGNSCSGKGICGDGQLECLDLHRTVCSTHQSGSAYIGVEELCDSLDNDCDGQTDENYKYPAPWPYCTGSECGTALGTFCTGVGECGDGVFECGNTGEKTRCSVKEYIDGRGNGSQFDPPAELCDGKDNDCDGETDEDFPLDDACAGIGECSSGVLECDGLNDTKCSTLPGGSAYVGQNELCDDLDNDCNGQTDEGYQLGGACDGVGECPNGELECDGIYRTKCSSNPGGSNYVSVAELCDNMDNDCDGETDELWPELDDEYCVVGNCGTGIWVCTEDTQGIECTALANADEEICNGIDDDCDGETDEDYNLGAGCIGVGQCGQGVTECGTDHDSIRCSTNPDSSNYGGSPEVCDYLDNDCDGLTDEDYKTDGAYNSDDHCGACNVNCNDYINAEGVCVDSECEMSSCRSGFADLNEDIEDGCECEIVYSGGELCSSAISLPDSHLSDSGAGEKTAGSGQLVNIADEMWFTFYAFDTADDHCDEFNIYIELAPNPDNKLRMDIFREGCNSQMVCENVSDYRFRTDSQFDEEEGRLVGECPCALQSDDVGEGESAEVIADYPNYCDDQSGTYHVRVYYAQGVTEPSCSTFKVAASNGR